MEPRHLEPRLVERPAAALQPLDGVGVQLERHAERLRHAFGRDVVVRGPDAAGGEHVGELAARLVQMPNDRVGLVAHDSTLGETNAELGELETEELQVRVLRLAGQDLVADDEHAGRRLAAHGGSGSARAGRARRARRSDRTRSSASGGAETTATSCSRPHDRWGCRAMATSSASSRSSVRPRRVSVRPLALEPIRKERRIRRDVEVAGDDQRPGNRGGACGELDAALDCARPRGAATSAPSSARR